MLRDETCQACHKGGTSLSANECENLLPELEGWALSAIESVPCIQREFRFKNYTLAVDFCNQVAQLAEQFDHHPRLVLEWGRVDVMWWTHAVAGLHRNDFIMAAKTSALQAP